MTEHEDRLPDPTRAKAYFDARAQFTLGPAELEELQRQRSGDIVLVDVRTASDFGAGHIPGAIHLPEAAWAEASGLSQDKLSIIYSNSQICHLAARAAAVLAGHGFPVMEMEGGFAAWTAEERATEQGGLEPASDREAGDESSEDQAWEPNSSAQTSPLGERLEQHRGRFIPSY